MFFKSHTPKAKLSDHWDEKTVSKLVAWDRLEVEITSATRLRRFGKSGKNLIGEIQSEEYEISGIMEYPRYLPVEISFNQHTDFGFWCYDTYVAPRIPYVLLSGHASSII